MSIVGGTVGSAEGAAETATSFHPRSPGVHRLFVSGGSLIRLHLTLRQMIEPRVFKDSGGPESNSQSDGRALKFLENNIQRQSDQANLPRDSHHDVEHIAEEIFVSLEAWVFRQYLLQDRTPKAPRPHTAEEVHQHRIVFRLGQQCTCQATNNRDNKYQWKYDRDVEIDWLPAKEARDIHNMVEDSGHQKSR